MTVNIRKKKSRMRGSHTHAGGHKKKRRGAGNRGGRGKAGSGKKGDGKKPSYWKNKNYFGKPSFKSINKTIVNSINIKDLDQKAEKLGKSKSGTVEIDLKSAGYDKLLGTGNTSKKLNVKVASATSKAISKVEGAGGSVTLPEQQ